MSTSAHDLTLQKFLQTYPWLESETEGKKPMDFLWRFELKPSVSDLWPFLIDTSTFNKLLGLPLMQYEEQDGKLFGESKNAGVLSKWQEVPWEWEFERGLNNARVYSQGFASYVRSRYLLENAGGSTVLYVYFGWIPNGYLYRLLLRLGMADLKKNYSKALGKIADILASRKEFEARQHAIFSLAAPVSRDPAVHEILERRTADAVKKGARLEHIEILARHIETAPEEELVRIRLKKVSRDVDLPVAELIPAALYAARAGMLSLSWDVTCPHCRGVRQELNSLGDVPDEETCDACDITFSTQDFGNLEVVFHVNPEIRAVAKKFYCAAEPATKTHIYVQRRLEPKAVLNLSTRLTTGEYRVRFSGNKQYQALRVEEAEAPNLKFENPESTEQTLIIERRNEDNDALRPHELFSLQLFRDLFGDQVLGHGLKLELGMQNILFTDIVGSTALYLKNGDGEAFRSVTRHFQKIYEIVRNSGGAVVKTIGDAAMVAFYDPVKCLEAALSLQQAINGSAETGSVLLRVSIHSGPCLAVNLNNGIDYFGNTVNYAAKLQQHADAHEIAMSPEFLHRAGVSEKLASLKITPKNIAFQPTWSEKPLEVHVFSVA